MSWHAAAIALIVAGTGCTYNSASIHSGLTAPVLGERVKDRWALGMSALEAERTATQCGLKPQSEVMPDVAGAGHDRHGMVASVEPPGLRLLEIIPTGVDTGYLYFWFDPEERLERVAYRVPPRHLDHPISEVRIIVERPEKLP